MTDMIFIPRRQGDLFINLNDILYIKSVGSYSLFVFTDHTEALVSRNTKAILNLLSGSANFFRVHRSWIVNINHVTLIRNRQNQTSHTIAVGKTHMVPLVCKVKKKFVRYLEEQNMMIPVQRNR